VDNVQGKFSAHVIAVPKLSGKKIAGTIECVGHHRQSFGIVNTPDAARWGHVVLLLCDTRRPNASSSHDKLDFFDQWLEILFL
jgi:hypothetical protein